MARTRRGIAGALGGAWRRARHPVMFPLWAGLLGWSLWSLHEQRGLGTVSLPSVGTVVDDALETESRPRTLVWSYDLYGVSERDAWRIIDTNLASFDEIARLWKDQPERVVQIAVTIEEEFAGRLAFTRRRTTGWVTLSPFSERTFTPEEEATLRRAAVDHLLLVYPGETLAPDKAGMIARLRAADSDRRTTLWRGYAVDAGLVAGAVMTTLSLARGVALAPELARRPRRWRRRRSGRCVGCGYALEGLTGVTCPECGMAIPASGQAAGPQPTEPLGDPPG